MIRGSKRWRGSETRAAVAAVGAPATRGSFTRARGSAALVGTEVVVFAAVAAAPPVAVAAAAAAATATGGTTMALPMTPGSAASVETIGVFTISSLFITH